MTKETDNPQPIPYKPSDKPLQNPARNIHLPTDEINRIWHSYSESIRLPDTDALHEQAFLKADANQSFASLAISLSEVMPINNTEDEISVINQQLAGEIGDQRKRLAAWAKETALSQMAATRLINDNQADRVPDGYKQDLYRLEQLAWLTVLANNRAIAKLTLLHQPYQMDDDRLGDYFQNNLLTSWRLIYSYYNPELATISSFLWAFLPAKGLSELAQMESERKVVVQLKYLSKARKFLRTYFRGDQPRLNDIYQAASLLIDIDRHVLEKADEARWIDAFMEYKNAHIWPIWRLLRWARPTHGLPNSFFNRVHKRYRIFSAALLYYEPLSLDEPRFVQSRHPATGELDMYEINYLEQIPDDSPSIEERTELNQLRAEFEKILRENFTEREREIIAMHYGLYQESEHTLEEVARYFQVTKERIRQIEHGIFRRLIYPSRPHRFLRVE